MKAMLTNLDSTLHRDLTETPWSEQLRILITKYKKDDSQSRAEASG